jgi:hypothetical protein
LNNYNDLYNKPTLNGKEIIGNMTCADVDIITPEQAASMITTALANYYTKTQIDAMIDYTEPTSEGE